MEKQHNIFVSVVFAVDAYAEGVADKVAGLARTMRARYANYEILVINNGLPLEELRNVQQLLPAVPCIRIIRLSKPHNTDTALFAGIEAAIGDFICTFHDNDPLDLLPQFVERTQTHDIVFGVAGKSRRKSRETHLLCMNRAAVNALSRNSGPVIRLGHMLRQVGFNTVDYIYNPPKNTGKKRSLTIRPDRGHPSCPLRALCYGSIAIACINLGYAWYLSLASTQQTIVAKGWKILLLQSSLMFSAIFIVLAVLTSCIYRVASEKRHEQPYHIMQELSSTISIADETPRNITK